MSRFVEGVHYDVHANGCWVWRGHVDSKGYAKTCTGSKRDGSRRSEWAHRIAWQETNGPVPDGLELDHLCRNPSCLRPDHMEPVTSAENTRRGAAAKLTWRDVRAIRASGEGVRATARRYGVDHSIVSRIRSRRAWWPEPAT